MDNHQKTINLLEKFLSNLDVEGICGYWVDPEIDVHSNYMVYVILDSDYIKNSNTKPGFIARMFREGVKKEIKKWLDLDVQVGSTSKKCDSISEQVKTKRYIITESQFKSLVKRNIE